MPSVKPKAFKAKRVTRNCVQTIKAAPSEVHALICPVKEAEWLDGWDYDLIFSQSGFAEAGCVFISRSEGEKETIWLITKRDDRNYETEFARITPESRVACLKVRIEDGGKHISRMHIAYTFTALTEEGNQFIDNFTEENFVKDMHVSAGCWKWDRDWPVSPCWSCSIAASPCRTWFTGAFFFIYLS
jgi:hypothetical protein